MRDLFASMAHPKKELVAAPSHSAANCFTFIRANSGMVQAKCYIRVIVHSGYIGVIELRAV